MGNSRNIRPLLSVAAAIAAGAAIGVYTVLKSAPKYDFRGKVVLITGGSRGLGLLMARELAAEGARLAICARNAEELERAKMELSEMGAQVLAVACDIRSGSEILRFVREAEQQLGEVNVLINNAGVMQVGPVEEQTEDDFESAMAVHFWAPFHAIMAVLPGMKRRGEGRIVNIGSIGGKISVPHMLPYVASKFALVGFSQGLRAELLKDGVYVTTVCPGMMRTGSHVNAEFKGHHKEEYAWFAAGAAWPVTSMDAGRAARKIVEAARRGKAELVMPIQAKLAVRFAGALPGLAQAAVAIANRAMPEPGGIGSQQVRGSESRSERMPGWFTRLIDRAAMQNNELGPPADRRR